GLKNGCEEELEQAQDQDQEGRRVEGRDEEEGGAEEIRTLLGGFQGVEDQVVEDQVRREVLRGQAVDVAVGVAQEGRRGRRAGLQVRQEGRATFLGCSRREEADQARREGQGRRKAPLPADQCR